MKPSQIFNLLLALLAVAEAGKFRQKDDSLNLGEADSAQVRQPKTDKRTYHHTTFNSGLRVLLVQDPEAQKSSYAMAVEVGSQDDPRDFQGLAHFCEHMVFLGSKKYPREDEFSDKLALYGGTNNAYTSSDQTVYYAEVGNEGFEETLDIFAQFFIEPTFASEMVDKEINAVDSEHKKNMPDTQRRLWHLLSSRANPESPVSKFATGNLKTLKTDPEKQGKSLEAALEAFHKKNYCPSRMHLVLMSNATVSDQLKSAHKSFDALGSHRNASCKPRPIYEDIAMYSHQLGNLGRHITLHTPGTPQLWLQFPMTSLRTHYKEQAETYVTYALNHYGPGGLKSLLKSEDLSLHYSAYFDTNTAGTVFFAIFQLTEKGARQTDKVLEYFFSYFNAIRKAGVDKDILEKVKAMNQVSFDYQEQSSSESSVVTTLAGTLPSVSPEDVLTAGFLIDKVDMDLTQQVLEAIVPDNMNVALVTPDFDDSRGRAHEEYYDFNYNEEALDSQLLARLKEASGFGLQPPPSLKYVPTNVELIQQHTKHDLPERLMKKEDGVELWWLGLGRFQLPKVTIQIKLGYPRSAVKTAARAVLAGMHSRLVNMALEEPSDALQMCGMSYGVSTGQEGISISFSGFDEHIVELVRLVMPVVRQPGNPSSDFEMARRQMILDLSDVTRQQPYEHALEAYDLATIKGSHSRDAMLKAAQDKWAVSTSTHKDLLADIFAEPTLSMLITGNIDKSRSKEIANAAHEVLGIGKPDEPEGFFDSLWSKLRHLLGAKTPSASDNEAFYPAVLKPKQELEIRVGNPIPEDPNSATIVTYQYGVPNLADRVRFSVISGVIDRPVFQVLRTEHQLGYVVFGYVTAHRDILEVRVLVQGFRESPDNVERLIESTVQNLTTGAFAQMDQKEFETRKASLRSDLTKPPSNLGGLAGKYWGQIWDETYCFDKIHKEVAFLDGKDFATPAALSEAWEQTVTEGKRRKLTVKLFGVDQTTGKASIPEASARKNINLITDMEDLASLSEEDRWPHKFICE